MAKRPSRNLTRTGKNRRKPAEVHEPPRWFHAPVAEDSWRRWPSDQEPIRELEILHVHGSDSDTPLVRSATVTVAPGVLPDGRYNPDQEDYDVYLRFAGRWNAVWRGTRLSQLSLDCFSEEWPEVIRLVFDPEEPVELLAAYNASFPGLNGLTIKAEDMLTRNARGEIMGHQVSARDPRLAIQIAARCPGVCEHTAWLEHELHQPTELSSEQALDSMAEIDAATKAIAGEPAPGAHLALDRRALQGIAAMIGGESERAPTPFIEPVAATLDTYTLIGASGIGELADADLVRVPKEIVSALAAHVTFPDAIEAIRATSSARLPLWLDFTDDQGRPQRRKHPSGCDQPLYGVLITDYQDDDAGAPRARVVVPVGRAAALTERALPLCAMAVGPDDGWRYPLLDNQIGLLSAHRGGVTVRHVRGYEHDLAGVEPELGSAEIRAELAGHVARCTEWTLARVGAVLSALEDGVLLLQREPAGQRTYRLVKVPATVAAGRTRASVDGRVLIARLRELGSVKRVAKTEGVDATTVREALETLGADPDQIRRDEVIQRFRATGSIAAVASELHIHRGDIERFLLEAGIDWLDTPIPHDVTDKHVMAAINAYREEGTLGAAGDRFGVSGETIRRRLAQAGLETSDVTTEKERRAAQDAVEAWGAAGHSLAGAARDLGIDPRTLKERLRRAGVSAAAAGTRAQRATEARQLHQLVGSPEAVSALMGISASSVRRYIEDRSKPTAPSRGGGRPPLSNGQLDQVELALAEHGSIRAAARSIGISPSGFSHRLKLAQARPKQQRSGGQ
ncbi:MAG: helix-turn-helix domain-containing protein [Solirubrobacteraceae bacterium]